MKIKSAILTSGSGSLGGMTLSHNRGGIYLRSRATPTNPNTAQQQAVRSILGLLASVWNSTLTAEQRSKWETYAINTPLVNAMGDTITLTGLQMYVRCNTPRQQAGLSRIDDGPDTYGVAEFSAPSVSASEATQQVSVVFNNSYAWATAVGGAMLVSISRPNGPAINFFKGPYRYAGNIPGAVVPPVSPQVIAVPFPVAAGQRVFVKIAVTDAEGRFSEVWRGFCDCAA